MFLVSAVPVHSTSLADSHHLSQTMKDCADLPALIQALQVAVHGNLLTSAAALDAAARLADFGYPYDYAKYPPLENTGDFQEISGTTPVNLAEA